MKLKYHLPKKQIALAFNRAAKSYDDAASLQRRVATQLLEEMFRSFSMNFVSPAQILEIGTGTGYLTADLERHHRSSLLVGIDIAETMIQKTCQRLGSSKGFFCCADGDFLPFKQDSFDLLISNLTLQWSSDLLRSFTEYARVLSSKGQLIFSTFGPLTLSELRHSWQAIDDGVHVNHFFDINHITQSLIQAGFEVSHFNTTKMTLYFPTVIALMKQLKSLGAHNVNQGRIKGLTGKIKLQRLIDAYEHFRQIQPAGLPVTYEVIYFIAKKSNYPLSPPPCGRGRSKAAGEGYLIDGGYLIADECYNK